MKCVVLATGEMSGCRVISEQPPAAGFAEPTLSIARRFRMSTTTSGGASTGGATVVIPVRWVPG
jgi:hypothetical protein